MRTKDENKSERIFQAAIDTINELGFAQSSMSKIAKRANVSASTIYVYFENKEDLINKIYLKVKRDMSQATFKDFEKQASLAESYRQCLRQFIGFAYTNQAALCLLSSSRTRH